MTTRRKFLKTAGALASGAVAGDWAGCVGVSSGDGRKKSNVRIEQITHSYDEDLFRAPVGFRRRCGKSRHNRDGEMFGSHRGRESRQRLRVDALQSHVLLSIDDVVERDQERRHESAG